MTNGEARLASRLDELEAAPAANRRNTDSTVFQFLLPPADFLQQATGFSSPILQAYDESECAQGDEEPHIATECQARDAGIELLQVFPGGCWGVRLNRNF